MKILKVILSLSLSMGLLYSCNSKSGSNGTSDTVSTSGTSGSGDDYYYESTVSTTGKDITMNELVKMYVSSKGDMRTEADITSSMNGNKVTTPMILIGKADKPAESISIDDSAKTYTINKLDTGSIE